MRADQRKIYKIAFPQSANKINLTRKNSASRDTTMSSYL